MKSKPAIPAMIMYSMNLVSFGAAEGKEVTYEEFETFYPL